MPMTPVGKVDYRQLEADISPQRLLIFMKGLFCHEQAFASLAVSALLLVSLLSVPALAEGTEAAADAPAMIMSSSP